MNYTDFFERIEKEGNRYNVTAEYRINNSEFVRQNEVNTVSAANTQLRLWRHAFKASLKPVVVATEDTNKPEQIAGDSFLSFN